MQRDFRNWVLGPSRVFLEDDEKARQEIIEYRENEVKVRRQYEKIGGELYHAYVDKGMECIFFQRGLGTQVEQKKFGITCLALERLRYDGLLIDVRTEKNRDRKIADFTVCVKSYVKKHK